MLFCLWNNVFGQVIIEWDTNNIHGVPADGFTSNELVMEVQYIMLERNLHQKEQQVDTLLQYTEPLLQLFFHL